MSRLLITIAVCFSLCLTTTAQTVRTPTLHIHVMDSTTKRSISGASVTVISGNDTITKVTTSYLPYYEGQVNFSEPLEDSVKVKVSYPKYETYHGGLKIIQPVGTTLRINNLNVSLIQKETSPDETPTADIIDDNGRRQNARRNRSRDKSR